MSQRNDQVFQLSLTEIAFTIAFILLLLLGYLVITEQSSRKAAEDALANIQAQERAAAALESAKTRLHEALQQAGVAHPDDIITHLVAAEEGAAERDRLRKRVEDLDAKLTALTEIKNRLDEAAQSGHGDASAELVTQALALQAQIGHAMQDLTGAPAQTGLSLENWVKRAAAIANEFERQYRTQFAKGIEPGQEALAVREVVVAARANGGVDQIKKENADLKGQVANLTNRLNAHGGRDFPPCWADDKGAIQYLLYIELNSDTVSVLPRWPASREADARALPGLNEVLARSPQSMQSFIAGIQGVFNQSRTRRCRHYVQLKSAIDDAVQSDRSRLVVEKYFYKDEVRR